MAAAKASAPTAAKKEAGAQQVDTIEVDGITIPMIVSKRLASQDAADAIADMADASLSEVQHLQSVTALYRTMFGSDYNRIKDELRARDADGILTQDAMLDFMQDVFEAINAKNS